MSVHPIVRARWLVLFAFALACAWLIPHFDDIRYDDDVLAFLPADDADVPAFHEVAERFGMLDIALVGLSVDGDAYAPETMD